MPPTRNAKETVAAQRFIDDGTRSIIPIGGELEPSCELALFAIGFEGVERATSLSELDLVANRRGALWCGSDWQTDAPGVFVCGDAHRGASLVVWAIAEGRAAARGRRVPDGRIRPSVAGPPGSAPAVGELMTQAQERAPAAVDAYITQRTMGDVLATYVERSAAAD